MLSFCNTNIILNHNRMKNISKSPIRLKGLVNRCSMLTFLLVSIITSLSLFAQDGSIDFEFDVGTGANNNVYLIKQLPDNKILIGGQFTNYNGNVVNSIARLNSDGSFDTTFNNGGDGIDFMVMDALIEPDSKIVLVGAFSSYNGVDKNCIVRIYPDGTLDSSFTVDADPLEIASISKQNDKYIITGEFSSINGHPSNNIARLNLDGSSDLSFDPTGTNNAIAEHIILPNNRIIIVGQFTTCQNESSNKIAILNPDGTLDATFNPGTGANYIIYTVCVQDDGKFIIGGNFSIYNNINKHLIARINADGSLDTTFNTEDEYNIPTSILVQDDGKIIVAGWNMPNSNYYMVRLNADGSYDTSFLTGTNFNNPVNEISFQTDGKILAGGWFTSYNDVSINRVIRLNNPSLSVFDLTDELNTVIYPNPTKSELFIQNSELVNAIELINLSGKQISLFPKIGADKTSIDISTLQNGIYFLKLTSYEKTVIKKVVKK